MNKNKKKITVEMFISKLQKLIESGEITGKEPIAIVDDNGEVSLTSEDMITVETELIDQFSEKNISKEYGSNKILTFTL